MACSIIVATDSRGVYTASDSTLYKRGLNT